MKTRKNPTRCILNLAEAQSECNSLATEIIYPFGGQERKGQRQGFVKVRKAPGTIHAWVLEFLVDCLLRSVSDEFASIQDSFKDIQTRLMIQLPFVWEASSEASDSQWFANGVRGQSCQRRLCCCFRGTPISYSDARYDFRCARAASYRTQMSKGQAGRRDRQKYGFRMRFWLLFCVSQIQSLAKVGIGSWMCPSLILIH